MGRRPARCVLEGLIRMPRLLRAYNLTKQVCIAPNIEVASTAVRRVVGLLGRRSLPPGHGMLLWPCSGVHTCFMRFPIDVVFLDRGGRAVFVAEGVPPFRFIPYVRGAAGVLELPAGALGESGTEVGDQIAFLEGDEPFDAQVP
ncbi:MAG: DUF192 domain-containing protein [Moorellaceae bacterium]